MVRIPIHPHAPASSSAVLNGLLRDDDVTTSANFLADTIPAGCRNHLFCTLLAGSTKLVRLLCAEQSQDVRETKC